MSPRYCCARRAPDALHPGRRVTEVNIVVTGINVGRQPYWNAEATMLMHTKGIPVMTPASAMVLAGKQALDFSGGVSAEDNFGIGGFGGRAARFGGVGHLGRPCGRHAGLHAGAEVPNAGRRG